MLCDFPEHLKFVAGSKGSVRPMHCSELKLQRFDRDSILSFKNKNFLSAIEEITHGKTIAGTNFL